ncbi:Hcp family type VI secretion system effector [Vannielia litorea]|nr:type VI secretion system tube protein Hcp [Vannielia litorea]
MYMKIEGPNVDGQSKAEGYENWINIESFSLGATQPGRYTTGKEGATKGICTPHDVMVTKETDSSTHMLWNRCFGGEHFKTVKIEVVASVKNKLEPYFRVTLTDAIVSSISGGGAGGGENNMMETLSWNYADILVEYAPKDNTGAMQAFKPAGYNVQTGKHY